MFRHQSSKNDRIANPHCLLLPNGGRNRATAIDFKFGHAPSVAPVHDMVSSPLCRLTQYDVADLLTRLLRKSWPGIHNLVELSVHFGTDRRVVLLLYQVN